jgi:hypothetical protein
VDRIPAAGKRHVLCQYEPKRLNMFSSARYSQYCSSALKEPDAWSMR